MKVVYFAATIFVLLFVCDASDEPKCKEGESYEQDCNTCTCTDAGVFLCTLRACFDGTPFPDTVPLTTVEPTEEHTEISETSGQVCTPNETKMQDCNRCKCSANGIVWICTRRLCLPTQPPKVPVNEPGFSCTPNEIFKDDCNTCSCDETGTLARCTAMACDPSERQKRSNVAAAPALITTTELPLNFRKGSCVPGTRWKQECNWCSCADNGFAFCTLRGCLGPHQQKIHKFHPHPAAVNVNQVIDTTVLPETTRVQEKKVIETNKVKRGVNDEKLPKRSDGRLRNQQSQSDTTTSQPWNAAGVSKTPSNLNDYGSTSEKQYTEEDLTKPGFSCTPSLSFKVACNTCWCATDGKSARYCTRQACKPKTYPTLAPQ